MLKYITIAEKFALDHEYDDPLEYHLCAVIVRGGGIISVGYNKKSTNGFVEHFADLVRGERDYCLSTHAELDAIYNGRSKSDLRGAKIYVVRIRPSGGVGMARPCPICQCALHSYGIKRAYYTISDTEYGVMKIVDPRLHTNYDCDTILKY